MFHPLAWLRALVFTFLIFASRSHASEETIFTSSVTYCTPPESLLIQRFDIAYFNKNQSISFNVSAASVQANINVTANLFLNVYGLNPINITIDLCTILGGALCPLPMYNFTGADSLTLPASLGIQNRIPGIAFKIPDLEGFAQLTLVDVKTGDIKACVQATLSNGLSARQRAVDWSTGGITLLFLLLAIAYTAFSPNTLLAVRLLELIALFQTIASSAFLNLNYPSVYRSYALNFAWAVGLFSTGGSLQASIDHMRHLTGGTLANATEGSAVGLVNRKLSPYNVPPTSNAVIVPGLIQSRGVVDALLDLDFPAIGGTLQALAKRSFSATGGGEVQTVTDQSGNVLQAGVPIYVNSIHIATANAFMTVFLVALIMFAIALGAFIVGYGLLLAVQRVRGRKADLDYPSFIRAWTIRLCLIAFFPLLIFIFYQWTLKDSWLSILLAVITFVAILGFIAYPSFRILRVARHSSPEELYSPSEHLSSYGPHYAHHRPPRFYFFLPLLCALFLKALFIAVVTPNGLAQVILLLIIEAALVAAHLVFRPHKSRGADVFGTFLATIRLVCTGLLIAFVQNLQVKAIPRVAIGIVIAVIFSVTVVIVVFNLALHAVLPLWRWRRGTKSTDSSSSLSSTLNSNKSMMEKGLTEKSAAGVPPATSWERVARPLNPTPEQNVPLDPYVLEPYPISPTGTSISIAEPPSVYTRSSATMTVGSLLPRRWSFSLSQPGSPSATSSLSHGRRDSSAATSSGHGHQRDSNTTSALPSPSPMHMHMVAEEEFGDQRLSREAPVVQHPLPLPATVI